MASANNYNYGRRACTEAPDFDQDEDYDLDNLEEDSNEGPPEEEEGEAVDLQNYKGIYANDEAGQKYQCPETGAHFEPKDLCKRLIRMYEKRKELEEQIDAMIAQEKRKEDTRGSSIE